ncbi:hypothetical protein COHA_007494 [Chlorella ohadii]|uniref:Uncharacterized protein n=1 Tax=Chlorella ohadii TaxID=2649997 RepID=A0AAD5DQN4_9CHLO|nr:hypothetical protein COHA_007494 [Chlorella ohadii]
MLAAWSVRTQAVGNVISDIGKYLSEAASQIFHPQTDSVPWEKSGKPFTGKIVHHEEVSRLRALEAAVDAAVADIQKSIDEAPEGGETPKQSEVGDVVTTTIQRVFGNNFKGDETEPKVWISGGYASRGRNRSQRELRHEYDRLTRFQSVVKKVAADVEQSNKDM